MRKRSETYNFSNGSANVDKIIQLSQQECIPVGCIPPALHCTGGLCPVGDLCPWGVSVRETPSPVHGGSLSGRPPPPCGQTDACENITLPQTSFVGGKNRHYVDMKTHQQN